MTAKIINQPVDHYAASTKWSINDKHSLAFFNFLKD